MEAIWVRKAVVGIVCITILLVGCATTGENTSGRTTGTVIGALGGAIIGYKQGGAKGALAGGLIGGAAGYAVGWLVDEYQAKKTKSAQQVREQYARSSQTASTTSGRTAEAFTPAAPTGNTAGGVVGAPKATPQAPQIHEYKVTVNPTDTLLRGKEGEIVSSFDLLAENDEAVKVEEEKAIMSPDGKELLKRRYAYKEVDGSGGYEFRMKIPVPKQVEQGKYAIASTLYVNGKEASSTNSGFQVVSRDDGRLIARR